MPMYPMDNSFISPAVCLISWVFSLNLCKAVLVLDFVQLVNLSPTLLPHVVEDFQNRSRTLGICCCTYSACFGPCFHYHHLGMLPFLPGRSPVDGPSGPIHGLGFLEIILFTMGFMLAILDYLLKCLVYFLTWKQCLFKSVLSMAKGTMFSELKFRVFPVVPGTLVSAVHTLVWVAVWNTGNMCRDSDIGGGWLCSLSS